VGDDEERGKEEDGPERDGEEKGSLAVEGCYVQLSTEQSTAVKPGLHEQRPVVVSQQPLPEQSFTQVSEPGRWGKKAGPYASSHKIIAED
jgi:hypothetical protein